MAALYWLLQAAIYLLCWPLAFGASGIDLLRSREYLWQTGVWIVTVMILQTAFVLPAFWHPGCRASASQRLGLALVGGLAVGLIAGLVAWLVTSTLRGWLGLSFDDAMAGLPAGQIWHLGFWIPFLAVSMVAIPLLAARAGRGTPPCVSALIAALVIAAMVLAGVFEASSLSGTFRWWALATLPPLSFFITVPVFLALLHRSPRELALSRIASTLGFGVLLEVTAILALEALKHHHGWTAGSGALPAILVLWLVGPLILGPALSLPMPHNACFEQHSASEARACTRERA